MNSSAWNSWQNTDIDTHCGITLRPPLPMTAPTPQGMDSVRPLNVPYGIWHQEVSSRTFKSCNLQHEAAGISTSLLDSSTLLWSSHLAVTIQLWSKFPFTPAHFFCNCLFTYPISYPWSWHAIVLRDDHSLWVNVTTHCIFKHICWLCKLLMIYTSFKSDSLQLNFIHLL